MSQENIIGLYCDGGVIRKNPSTIGGTFAFCGVNDKGERIVEKSGVWVYQAYPITNNMTELLAIVNGLLTMPKGWTGTVYSDSNCSLGRVFHGWKLTNVPQPLCARLGTALKHVDLENCKYVLLQGHPTKADLASGIGKKRGYPVSIHNVWCDKECARRAEEYITESIGENAT